MKGAITAAILFLGLIILAPGVMYAQQQAPPSPPPLPPQAQADINARDQYATGIIDQINAIMNKTHDFTFGHFNALLREFDAQGKINCPHPGVAPFHQCFLVPKSVPQGPELLLPPQEQHTQLTPQEQRLSNCPASVINSTPPLVPGAFPVCPGSPLLPLNAHPPRLPLPPQALADTQKGHAILDELFKRIGDDTSPAHVAAVVKQMQSIYPGLVHCPTVNNTGQCYVTSKPLGGPISPPIAP